MLIHWNGIVTYVLTARIVHEHVCILYMDPHVKGHARLQTWIRLHVRFNMAKKNVVLVIFFLFLGGSSLLWLWVFLAFDRERSWRLAQHPGLSRQVLKVCVLYTFPCHPSTFPRCCPLFQENDLLVLKRFEALNTLISCQLIVTACGAVLAIVLLQMNCHGLWLATILAFMASSMYRLEAW
jgi:hypothetical protein